MTPQHNWTKYAYTFLITAVIFGTAIFANNIFNQKRLSEIKDIESRIAVDILSSETQFSLLSELSCTDIGNSFFSRELSELGQKLDFTEKSRGADDEEVVSLKRYYSLLQIKDFLLLQKVKEKCGKETAPYIIYIYSNKGDCPDCEREGYVLTRLREDYPELRVYSFDYNLDLSALRTLISIYNIKYNPPMIIIGNKVLYGFQSLETIHDLIPELAKIDAARKELEEVATSTEN